VRSTESCEQPLRPGSRPCTERQCFQHTCPERRGQVAPGHVAREDEKRSQRVDTYSSEVTSGTRTRSADVASNEQKPTTKGSNTDATSASHREAGREAVERVVAAQDEPTKQTAGRTATRDVTIVRHCGRPRWIGGEGADHVDGLDQVLLEVPSRMSRANARGQARAAGEHPANVDEEQVGDHLAEAEWRARRCSAPELDGVPEEDSRDIGEGIRRIASRKSPGRPFRS